MAPLVAITAVLSSLAAVPLRAQEATPVDDLIRRVIGDLNDLRYADAVARGREALSLVPQMTPAQEARLRTAVAAAYYPEEEPASQQPDSAIAQFAAALYAQPDLAIPIELRWAGLDSLLGVARARTFALRMDAEPQELVGPRARGTLRVMSSRAARFTLRTGLLGSATQLVQDSSATMDTEATLGFRALAGDSVLLAPGEYEATLFAADAAGQTATLRARATVTGTPLLRVAPPAFDSSQLRRVTTRPPVLRTALTTLAFATATFVIGSLSGGDGEFGDDFEPDGRAAVMGLAIVGAGAGSYWLAWRKHDPDAAAHNARVVEAHRRAVEEAEAESRRRVENYRVTVTLRPEPR